MTVWSQQGTNYTEANSGATRAYGTNNNDMANTAIGNINKTPGLGLTQGGADYDAKYATYLKLFSGEMIKAYESECIIKELFKLVPCVTVSLSSLSTLDA